MACPKFLVRIGLAGAIAAWAGGPALALSPSQDVETPTAEPPEEGSQEDPTVAPGFVGDPIATEDTKSQPEIQLSPEPTPLTARQRLDTAWRNYQLGKRELARTELAELVTDTDVEDLAIRQQARIYLGELLYVQDDEEGARRFFEQVLHEDPDYTIDPFRHPPDVVGFFTYVRSYVVPIAPPVDPVGTLQYPRAPISTWGPFGAYHLTHHAPRRGSLYLVGGLATAATSVILFGVLQSDRTYGDDEEAEFLRLRRLKAAQYSATGSFYVLWTVSVYDANSHWRRNRKPIGQATPTVSLSGRF